MLPLCKFTDLLRRHAPNNTLQLTPYMPPLGVMFAAYAATGRS
jgi:hypothetical protein